MRSWPFATKPYASPTRATLDASAERFVDYWMGEGAWAATPPDRRPALAAAMRTVKPEWHAAFREPTPLAAFAAIDVPTLLLTGTASKASARAVAGLLATVLPRLVTYLLSFMTLGIFWVGQGTQLRCIERADRHFTWLQIAVLAVVAVIPFSTGLLAEFITFRLALLFYWLNILLFGIAVYACWSYAGRAGLYRSDVTPEMELAFRNRVIRAQALYAIGAALCIINTYWSIGFIVAVQVVYATAPPVRWLQKLTG